MNTISEESKVLMKLCAQSLCNDHDKGVKFTKKEQKTIERLMGWSIEIQMLELNERINKCQKGLRL